MPTTFFLAIMYHVKKNVRIGNSGVIKRFYPNQWFCNTIFAFFVIFYFDLSLLISNECSDFKQALKWNNWNR